MAATLFDNGYTVRKAGIQKPTTKTLTKVATAMTALGVPTTVVDLFQATHHSADAR